MRRLLTITALTVSVLVVACEAAGAEPRLVYDIPRLTGITIDGEAADWGDNGLQVDAMAVVEGQGRPVRQGNARFRVGWTDQGLAVLVSVTDTTPSEAKLMGDVWSRDSVTIMVVGGWGGPDGYRVTVSPGVDPNWPTLRYEAGFRERFSGKGVACQAARRKGVDGYVIEALLPWTNLPSVPGLGSEIAVQVCVNDADATGTATRWAWYPGAVGNCVTGLQRVRLAGQAGARVVLTAAGRQAGGGRVVTVQGDGPLAGQNVEIACGGKVVATGAMAVGSDGRAGVDIPMPKALAGMDWTDAEIALSGQPATKIVLTPLTLFAGTDDLATWVAGSTVWKTWGLEGLAELQALLPLSDSGKSARTSLADHLTKTYLSDAHAAVGPADLSWAMVEYDSNMNPISYTSGQTLVSVTWAALAPAQVPTKIEEEIGGTVVKTTYIRMVTYGSFIARRRVTVETYNSDHTGTDTENGDTDSRRFETTITFYHLSGIVGKNYHQKPWFTVSPEGVRRYLAANGATHAIYYGDPGSDCDLDTVSADDLKPYADMIYESYDSSGRVTETTGSGGCCGGGGGAEGTYKYSYVDKAGSGPNGIKKVVRILEPTGLRRVKFYNERGQQLYDVVQTMSGTSIDKLWITRTVLGTTADVDEWCVTESHSASACAAFVKDTDYTVASGSGDFAGEWVDSFIASPGASGTAGLVQLYEYYTPSDTGPGEYPGRLKCEKVRQGALATGGSSHPTYWVRKYTYEKAEWAGNAVYHPKTVRTYANYTASDTGGDDTTYSYAWYDTNSSDNRGIKITTVTYPIVSASPDHHGSGSATTVRYYYARDTTYNLYWNQWTQHEDGSLSYTALNSNGLMTSSVRDANTNTIALPGDISSWGPRASGLNLVTNYAYDSWSRLATIAGPDGITSKYAYTSTHDANRDQGATTRLVTLVTPFIDGANQYDFLPVSISVTDMDGRTLISAGAKPATVAGGNLFENWTRAWTDGTTTVKDAFTAATGSCWTWREDLYDDADHDGSTDANNKGLLAETRQYHNVPTAANDPGSVTDNYYMTVYNYDTYGRREYAIDVMAGTSRGGNDGLEAVTQTVYDGLGRVTETRQAASPAGSNMGSGYTTYPTMVTISQTWFDESTPGDSTTAGVGDGRATSTLRKLASGANDGVQNRLYYDYRGRIRGLVTAGYDTVGSNWVPVPPYPVTDYDNAGRAIAEATYVSAPTWTGMADVYAATTTSGRRSLSLTSYDEKGQVYQSQTCELNTDGTTAGNVLLTDYWHDDAGRLVKTADPTGLFHKSLYDTAGRAIGRFDCYDTDGTDNEKSDHSGAGTAYEGAQNVWGDTIFRGEWTEYSGDRVYSNWVGSQLGNAPVANNPNAGNPAGDFVQMGRTYYHTDRSSSRSGSNRPYVTGVETLHPNVSGYDTKTYVPVYYYYDTAGRRDRTVLPDPDGAGTTLHQTMTALTFDNAGRTRTTVTGSGTLTSIPDGTWSPGTYLAGTENVYGAAGVETAKVYDASTIGGTIVSLDTAYTYDAFGRVLTITPPGPTGTTTYQENTYNTCGTLLATYVKEKATGNAVVGCTASQCDRAGRQIASWQGVALGSTASPFQPDSGTGAKITAVTQYWYDDNWDQSGGTDQGRVTGVSILKAATSVAYALTKYDYDGYGRRYMVTYPDPDGTGSGNPSIIVKQYHDTRGRPSDTKTYYDANPNPVLTNWTVNLYDGSDGILLKRSWVYKVSGSPAGSAPFYDYMETSYDYGYLGNVCKVTLPSGAFTKTRYSYTENVLTEYLGTGTCSSSEDPKTVWGNIIIEQTNHQLDCLGREILTTTYRRTDGNSTKEGDLAEGFVDPELDAGSGWSSSDSRRTYVARWYDDLGRLINVTNYGTNNDSDLTRSDTPPTLPGDNTRITSAYGYDNYGRQNTVTDNRNQIAKTFHDDAGRPEYVVANFKDFAPGATPSGYADGTIKDEDQTVKFEYDAAGRLSKRTALVAAGSHQETVYSYNPASDNTTYCPVYRKDLVVTIAYPDTQGGSDTVQLKYMANGAVNTRTDQRTIVHQYTYDDLGRLTMDAVVNGTGSYPTWPAEVDDSVKSITRSYEAQGRTEKIRSWPTVDASGTPANEIKYTYTASQWGRMTKSEQEHEGAVHTSSPWSPNVEYVYSDNPSSHKVTYSRLTRVIYPGPISTYYNYVGETGDSVADQQDAVLNRVGSISDYNATTKFAAYRYLGASTIVEITHPQVASGYNKLKLTYKGAGPGQYPGWDQLDRVVDQKWTVGSTLKDEFAYGYDENSNRLYRKNMIAHAATKYFDELYHTNGSANGYDGLDRLREFRRGWLEDTLHTVTHDNTLNRRQEFTLDTVGNWTALKSSSTHSSWDLDQSRTHNKANEIDTDDDHATFGDPITGTPNWKDPRHDAAGNMYVAPRPGDEGTGNKKLICRYDAWNRLAAVYEDADDDSVVPVDAGDTLLVKYKHDGLHRRVAKLVPNGESWNRTDYYHNENWQVLEETYSPVDDETTRPDPASFIKYRYIWDLHYIDAPTLREVWQSSSLVETLHYTYDANFNVTSMVNTSGAVQKRFVYDAYGKPTIYDDTWTNTTTTNNEILFAGYRYDPETGLYHVRHRMYHPTLGRWLQRDPIEYGGGMNMYQYTQARSASAVDPLGLREIPKSGTPLGEPGRVEAWIDFKFISNYAKAWVTAAGASAQVVREDEPRDNPETLWGFKFRHYGTIQKEPALNPPGATIFEKLTHVAWEDLDHKSIDFILPKESNTLFWKMKGVPAVMKSPDGTDVVDDHMRTIKHCIQCRYHEYQIEAHVITGAKEADFAKTLIDMGVEAVKQIPGIGYVIKMTGQYVRLAANDVVKKLESEYKTSMIMTTLICADGEASFGLYNVPQRIVPDQPLPHGRGLSMHRKSKWSSSVETNVGGQNDDIYQFNIKCRYMGGQSPSTLKVTSLPRVWETTGNVMGQVKYTVSNVPPRLNGLFGSAMKLDPDDPDPDMPIWPSDQERVIDAVNKYPELRTTTPPLTPAQKARLDPSPQIRARP